MKGEGILDSISPSFLLYQIHMPYPKQEDYIGFLFRLIDEFESSHPQPKGPGRPVDYEDRSLICFFVIMILKRCFAFKAMHRWLS